MNAGEPVLLVGYGVLYHRQERELQPDPIEQLPPPYRCRCCDKGIYALVGLRPHQRYCSAECRASGPQRKRR